MPPDLGNGVANSGVSLARLLWFLTPRQAVTLVASLLLERRIILVARDADTVSAAVHAANALIYPFSWQHIYLPLLPLALKVRRRGRGKLGWGSRDTIGHTIWSDQQSGVVALGRLAPLPTTHVMVHRVHTCLPSAGLPGRPHALPGGHPGRLPAAAARHAAGGGGHV